MSFCNCLFSFLLASSMISFIDLPFVIVSASSTCNNTFVPNLPFDLIASSSFSAIFRTSFSAFSFLLSKLLPLAFCTIPPFWGSSGRISMSRSWNSRIKWDSKCSDVRLLIWFFYLDDKLV